MLTRQLVHLFATLEIRRQELSASIVYYETLSSSSSSFLLFLFCKICARVREIENGQKHENVC